MRFMKRFCISIGSLIISTTSGLMPSSISCIICLAGIALVQRLSNKYLCCSTTSLTSQQVLLENINGLDIIYYFIYYYLLFISFEFTILFIIMNDGIYLFYNLAT